MMNAIFHSASLTGNKITSKWMHRDTRDWKWWTIHTWHVTKWGKRNLEKRGSMCGGCILCRGRRCLHSLFRSGFHLSIHLVYFTRETRWTYERFNHVCQLLLHTRIRKCMPTYELMCIWWKILMLVCMYTKECFNNDHLTIQILTW